MTVTNAGNVFGNYDDKPIYIINKNLKNTRYTNTSVTNLSDIFYKMPTRKNKTTRNLCDWNE